MGFFGKLFGSSSDEKPKRTLEKPEQLQVGDIITLDDSFALPALLRGQSLEIKQINTYEYEFNKSVEWVLQGSTDDILFLSVENDDVQTLVFSLKISRDIVGQIFDLDEFSQLFDEPGRAVLNAKELPPEYSQWAGQVYRQCEFAQFGYFHDRVDYRSQRLNEDQGDSFERYSAESDDEKYGVEAEVYEGGETDVVLTVQRPITDIRQYWPKS
ncbi:MAG: hypothetical protein ACPG8A_05075 [Psychrobium sp.]